MQPFSSLLQGATLLGPLAKKLYKKQTTKVVVDGEVLCARKYLKHVVLYAEGDPLVGRLTNDRDIYEPGTVTFLWRAIKRRRATHLLDIGANIGLISIAMLYKFPKLRIDAFEPGPFQSHIFERTIKYNGLDDRIRLNKIALGERTGETDFFVHFYNGVPNGGSGDGIVDTGRAGEANRITVPMQTLDEWWHTAGKPSISVVKLDVEGAELLVMKGAVQFIRECKPTVFLEICSANLRSFPFGENEVLNWLESRNYRLYTPRGEHIAGGLSEHVALHGLENYVAEPMEMGT